MKTSDQIDKLAAALCEFQGEVKNPARNRTVRVNSDKGSYTFDYATLDAILAENRPLLKKHGLSIAQGMESDSQLSTRLIHSSGQWIEVVTPVVIGQGRGPQALGSAITYARRYAIAPLLAIAADEDDDGNGAEGNPHAGTPRGATAPQTAKAPYVPDHSMERRGPVKPPVTPGMNPPAFYIGEDGKPYCFKHERALALRTPKPGGKQFDPFYGCPGPGENGEKFCKSTAKPEAVAAAVARGNDPEPLMDDGDTPF